MSPIRLAKRSWAGDRPGRPAAASTPRRTVVNRLMALAPLSLSTPSLGGWGGSDAAGNPWRPGRRGGEPRPLPGLVGSHVSVVVLRPFGGRSLALDGVDAELHAAI